MRHFTPIVAAILATLFIQTLADYNPCNGLARLGEDCDTTEDCSGAGVICQRGNCTCHPYYEEKKNKDSIYCSKVPDQIGAPCDGKCRHPMFCRSGKCTCVTRGTSKVVNGQCVVASEVSDQCKSNEDCTQPFSACVGGKCSCIAGSSVRTKKVGTTTVKSCVAAKHCPAGNSPGQKCIRYTNNQQVVNNHINSGGKADNCPKNQYCVTPEGSPIGHCCKVTCPLSTFPDDRYSCEPGVSNGCPTDTHHCHRVSGPGYAFATCCKRPCDSTSPEAVYIKGACYERGYLNAPCSRQEQCDGFQTMQCSKGNCSCKGGYEPKTDIFTSSRKNPSQQCQKRCSGDLGRDKECFRKVSLGSKCYVQEQCTANAGCYRGKCRCKCGYDANGNSCRLPPTTTTRKPPPGGQGLVPGGSGSLPSIEDFSADKLVDLFQNFLKGIGGSRL